MMYTEQVMDHFMNPRNVGEIEDASGVGTVGNAKCGDIMKIFIKVKDNVITDVKFKTFGCGAAIATSSKATEMVKGKTIEEALQITNKQVADSLGGLPPVKIHCSLLAEEALHAAIQDYKEKLARAKIPSRKTTNKSAQTGGEAQRSSAFCIPGRKRFAFQAIDLRAGLCYAHF